MIFFTPASSVIAESAGLADFSALAIKLHFPAAIYNPDPPDLGFQAHHVNEIWARHSVNCTNVSDSYTPKPGYSDFPDPPVVSVIQSSWQASLSLTVNRFRQALASVDVHHAQGKQERSLYARIANGKVAAN